MNLKDDDRYATQRATMLARSTELRKVEAKALAYAERGYSSGGIAEKMDTGASTVKTYFDKAIALYGFEALEQKVLPEDSNLPTYERVSPSYHESREDGDEWVDIVLDHEGTISAEFIEDVKESAIDSNVIP